MTPPPDEGEVITPQEELPPGSLWVPNQGAELRGLLDHLVIDSDSKETLANEAATILGKCIPPGGEADSTTGLVLGYVQSGKTLSFTAVGALARDNGYPMVIVITGIATNLLDQSRGRLEADLRLQTNRKWRLFLNPKPDQRQAVADVLRDWTNDRVPDHRRKTVLITVLKNGTHLRNLVALLGQLDLSRIPVLVIDDEADQAGLNTQAARGRQSTTYQRLVALREHRARQHAQPRLGDALAFRAETAVPQLQVHRDRLHVPHVRRHDDRQAHPAHLQRATRIPLHERAAGRRPAENHGDRGEARREEGQVGGAAAGLTAVQPSHFAQQSVGVSRAPSITNAAYTGSALLRRPVDGGAPVSDFGTLGGLTQFLTQFGFSSSATGS